MRLAIYRGHMLILLLAWMGGRHNHRLTAAAIIGYGPASLGRSHGSVLRPLALFTASGLNGLGGPRACEPTGLG